MRASLTTAGARLTKPLAGLDPHRGGDIFPDSNDPAVDILRMGFD